MSAYYEQLYFIKIENLEEIDAVLESSNISKLNQEKEENQEKTNNENRVI